MHTDLGILHVHCTLIAPFCSAHRSVFTLQVFAMVYLIYRAQLFKT